MAYKQFVLDEHTTITIYKRKANRSLRLSITPDGQVKVSIPVWAPYNAGLKFAKSKETWISAQKRPLGLLVQGQTVGKAHRLRFEPVAGATVATSRLRQNEAVIYYPDQLSIDDPEVQRVAQAVGIRALRAQAQSLLPQRLADLAAKHGFTYSKISIKQMKSRWGSCDSHTNIVLNLFLIQLPWECIDYVILHELTHTKVLKHGPEFWSAMESVLPSVSQMRKVMRGHQPVLHNSARLVA